MALNMARISGGSVVNIESWKDGQQETNNLKKIGNIPVAIGDFYRNGKYYRGSEELFDPLVKENQDLLAALAETVEMLYEADLAIIGE